MGVCACVSLYVCKRWHTYHSKRILTGNKEASTNMELADEHKRNCDNQEATMTYCGGHLATKYLA